VSAVRRLRVWVKFNQLGDVAPVPNARHHVLADPKSHQSVIFEKQRRALMDAPDALFQPSISERKGLVPSESVFEISSHRLFRTSTGIVRHMICRGTPVIGIKWNRVNPSALGTYEPIQQTLMRKPV
jgi:hypothetical protein